MAGESEGHRQLKRGAFLWAQAHGYSACAEEVRLPNSGYRADIVGCKPGKGDKLGPTAIFECKWSRAQTMKKASCAKKQHRMKQHPKMRETRKKCTGVECNCRVSRLSHTSNHTKESTPQWKWNMTETMVQRLMEHNQKKNVN